MERLQLMTGYLSVKIRSLHSPFSTWNWKGFDLFMDWYGVSGRKIKNGYLYEYNSGGSLRGKLNGVKVDYWTPFNPSNKFPRPSYSADPAYLSAIAIQDASYIRLRTLQLGYTFPTRLLKNTPIHKLRLYATATNLLTFTEFKSYSPELTPGLIRSPDNMCLVSMFHSKIKNPYEKVNIYSLCHLRNVDRFLLGFIKSGIKTDVTNNYLFTTPEGLNTAVTGLYSPHVNCRVERIITNLICTSLPCVTLIRILPYLEQVFLPQSDV